MTISNQLRYHISSVIQQRSGTSSTATACLHATRRTIPSLIQQRRNFSHTRYRSSQSGTPIDRAAFNLTQPRTFNADWDAQWVALVGNLKGTVTRTSTSLLAKKNTPPDDLWRQRSQRLLAEMELAKAGLREEGRKKDGGAFASDVEVLGVSTGRTVSSSNFQSAIKTLNRILQQNRVKREWQRDRHFTQPSALRYQLRSQRHRRRFAAMVRRKVQIVQAIKRRGM